MKSSSKNFIVAILLIILLACGIFSIKKFQSIKKIENDHTIIDKYVSTQKNKTPLKIDQFTDLINVDFKENRLISTYSTSADIKPGIDTSIMKKYFLSKLNKEEICKNIFNNFEFDIKVEYNYFNLNNEHLFKTTIDKQDCL